jgi:glycosyltransferase involved in cell wall biosynthesis
MKLIIVVPCYNEEEVLRETTRQLTSLVDSMINEGLLSECDIIYVDDGSKDNTWQIIEELQIGNRYVHGLKLAHNVGHQNALWAGLSFSVGKCDAVVSIDADLQHDIHKIILQRLQVVRVNIEVFLGGLNILQVIDYVSQRIGYLSFSRT